MQIPDIPSELFYTFNDVVYYDEPHKYFLDDKPLTSVTTLIHRYEEEFNEEYWSDIKSKEFNVSQNEIKYAWNFINKKATTKGSIIHDYTENIFLNKIFPYPKLYIENKFGYDVVYDEYEKTKRQVDRFYHMSKNRLIPIKTEFIVFDREYMIGGMVDILFWNVKAQEFQIWDYKTNKNFTFESKTGENLTGKLYLLENCDLEKYSLQLSSYKYIIEKNTSIKLGKSYLVWFSHLNDNYEIIETKNREYYVKEMFEDNILYNIIN